MKEGSFMVISLERLLAKLKGLPKRQNTLIIGLDGRGAAGKSTLARKLKELSQNVTIVHMDDFYKPSSERKLVDSNEIGGNFDWKRVKEQVITPLLEDKEARYQRYDWDNDEMAEWHAVPVGGLVIIEGCYSIRNELADLYDFRIWVEGTRAFRLDRGVKRDGEQYRHFWEDVWLPAEDRYFEIQSPASRADITIDGSGKDCDIDNNEFTVLRNFKD